MSSAGAATIRDLRAFRTFDGCARPSLEVHIRTEAASVRAAPSYSDPRSSGKYEIVHFPKQGVAGSIELINTVIRDRLIGRDAADQEAIDELLESLDGTPDFSNLGGNTCEAVSIAAAKAGAASLGVPLYRYQDPGHPPRLPHLMLNIIGGGATMGDEGWRGRTPDLQDHLIVPVGFSDFHEAMAGIAAVFHKTGELLREADRHFSGGRDEEYCWIPMIDDETAMDILKAACEAVGRTTSGKFRLGLDIGASDLWREDAGRYVYANAGIARTRDEQSRYIADLIEKYDLIYVEDAFFEDHVELYVEQCRQFGRRSMIIGDDLLATSLERLEALAARGAVNAAVVKLNMAGTVTRTRRFSEACRRHGFATIGASRTYDSPDDTIADLVVGWGHTGYKCGSPAGGEHVAKYNRFIRIAEELGDDFSFAAYPAGARS